MTTDATPTASADPGRPASSGRRLLRDLMTLTKPGVTRMCALTAAGAAWMALRSADNPFGAETPADGWCSPGFAVAFAGVVGASLAVAGASALNMWLERAKDPLMVRTRTRPLALAPGKRQLAPGTALGFALALCFVALAVLWLFTNPLTAVLAAWAIVGYALVYTPLKYRTPLALVIGAVPGAVPPLLGWTAVTGDIDAGGLALFAILLVWQMPHFLAITLFRESDFARFVAPNVDPAVRNAAMKKLFADPHFNVMDGLDTYIDDYNKFEPIPRSMLRQMVNARALGLLDDELEEQPMIDNATAHHDPNADLQLQPDDAAGQRGAAEGAAEPVGPAGVSDVNSLGDDGAANDPHHPVPPRGT